MSVINALASLDPTEYDKTSEKFINAVTRGIRYKVYKAAGKDLLNLMETTPPDKDITAVDVMKIAQKWKLSEGSMQKLMQHMKESGALDKMHFDMQRSRVKATREDELYPYQRDKTIADTKTATAKAKQEEFDASDEMLGLKKQKEQASIDEINSAIRTNEQKLAIERKKLDERLKALETKGTPEEKRRATAIRMAMKDSDWEYLTDDEQVERVDKYEKLSTGGSGVQVVNPGPTPQAKGHGKVVDRYIVNGKVTKLKYEDGYIEDVK